MPALSDLDDIEEGLSNLSLENVSLAKMDRRFRVRAVGCDNIYIPRGGDFMRLCSKFDENNCQSFEVFLEIGLRFGGEPLGTDCRSKETIVACSPRYVLSIGGISVA